MEFSQQNVEGRQLTKSEIRQQLRNEIASFKNHQHSNKQAITK